MLCPAYRGVICMWDFRFGRGIAEDPLVLVYDGASLYWIIGFHCFEATCWPHFQGLQCPRINKNTLDIFIVENEGTTFSRKQQKLIIHWRGVICRRIESSYNQSDCGPVQVYLRMFQCENNSLVTSSYVDVATFNSLTPLLLTFPCRLSLRIFGLKIRTLYIYINLHRQNFHVAIKTWSNTDFNSPCKIFFWILTFNMAWDRLIKKCSIKTANTQCKIRHPTTKTSTL